jgi:hypothetical protein
LSWERKRTFSANSPRWFRAVFTSGLCLANMGRVRVRTRSPHAASNLQLSSTVGNYIIAHIGLFTIGAMGAARSVPSKNSCVVAHARYSPFAGARLTLLDCPAQRCRQAFTAAFRGRLMTLRGKRHDASKLQPRRTAPAMEGGLGTLIPASVLRRPGLNCLQL